MSTLTKTVLFLVSQGVIGRHAAEHYARSSDAKVFGVANIDRQDLLNNVLVLAKAAKIFHVPVILTAVESEGLSGNITPQPLERRGRSKPGLHIWKGGGPTAMVRLSPGLPSASGNTARPAKTSRHGSTPLNSMTTPALEEKRKARAHKNNEEQKT